MAKSPPAFTHAVIMGDLVASQQIAAPAALHKMFNAAIAAANEKFASAINSPLTVTLGDEFQGLSRTLVDGLGIVRSLRLDLKARGIECRFLVGLVRIETPVNTKAAWNMMGPGLAEARYKVSDKKNPNAYRFSLPENPPEEKTLDTLGLFLTDIENDWTDRQFELVRQTLETGEPAKEIAGALDVSPRVVYKIRKSAKLPLYVEGFDAIETALGAFDARNRLG